MHIFIFIAKMTNMAFQYLPPVVREYKLQLARDLVYYQLMTEHLAASSV